MLNVFRPALTLRRRICDYVIHLIKSIQVKTPTVKTLSLRPGLVGGVLFFLSGLVCL